MATGEGAPYGRDVEIRRRIVGRRTALVIALALHGPTAAAARAPSTIDVRAHAALMLTGEHRSDLAGASVAAAGDVNGDGRDDVIVGAPLADPRAATMPDRRTWSTAPPAAGWGSGRSGPEGSASTAPWHGRGRSIRARTRSPAAPATW